MQFKHSSIATTIISACILAGCGGSGGGSTPETPEVTTQFTVIDGYLKDATGWLDLNGDLQQDSGEPSEKSDSHGLVTIKTDYELPTTTLLAAKIHAGTTVDVTYSKTFENDLLLVSNLDVSLVSPYSTLEVLYQRAGEEKQTAREQVCHWIGQSNCDLNTDYIAADDARLSAIAKALMPIMTLEEVLDDSAALSTKADAMLTAIAAEEADIIDQNQTPLWSEMVVVEQDGSYIVMGLSPVTESIIASTTPQEYTLFDRAFDQDDPYSASLLLHVNYHPEHGFMGVSMPGDLIKGFVEYYGFNGEVDLLMPYGEIRGMQDDSGYEYQPDALSLDTAKGLSIVGSIGTTTGEDPAGYETTYRKLNWDGELSLAYQGELTQYSEMSSGLVAAADDTHIAMLHSNINNDFKLDNELRKYDLTGELTSSLQLNRNVSLTDDSYLSTPCSFTLERNNYGFVITAFDNKSLCVVDAALNQKTVATISDGTLAGHYIVDANNFFAVIQKPTDDPSVFNYYLSRFNGSDWTQIASLGQSESYQLGQAVDGRVVVTWVDSQTTTEENEDADNFLDTQINFTLKLLEVGLDGRVIKSTDIELPQQEFDFSAGEVPFLDMIPAQVSGYGAVYSFQRHHREGEQLNTVATALVVPFTY
ncbi:hypothetical protein ACFSJ3_15115 [Corallincola platygyrae]|uniref:Uncharacterized protein n=1 Tax=Corallincola platygyrae TaxID=1193278 RepID=A0ABW4XP47_9GAMM